MPLWLRKYTFSEIKKHYDDEKKEYDKENKGQGETNLINSDGTVNTPAFAQASKSTQNKTSPTSNPFKGKSSYK